MTVLFVAVLGLMLAAVLAVWPRSSRADGTRPGWVQPETAARQPDPITGRHRAGHAEPATLEGILTAQLISGEITQRQYLRALENLAARDEERHPLSLRWDDRPGAWS
ncbi:hypothetical protein [Actinoplanes sp. DH11]|uniref:hypothetical protein n=1 Tax=Actinoplanes sp. DH11 TaxID=2857011 RepID=UPI001E63411F|nr:hypothetical protein [Actinoplanes sp. DH11]